MYRSQAARDAQAANYGNETYWDYLETKALEYHALFLRKGDLATAAAMLTRSLSSALDGNNGD